MGLKCCLVRAGSYCYVFGSVVIHRELSVEEFEHSVNHAEDSACF